jgi:hypothetical protein
MRHRIRRTAGCGATHAVVDRALVALQRLSHRARGLPVLNPSRFNERYGRHEETRTPDLYRVNGPLAFAINNLQSTGRNCKCTKNQVRANGGHGFVPELCTTLRNQGFAPNKVVCPCLATVVFAWKSTPEGHPRAWSQTLLSKH